MKSPKDYWAEILILVSTSALFSIKGVFSFLTVENFAGRDLVSNYAFTHLMKQNIVSGEIFSWINQWLLGFPSFELYPPVFFMTTSLLDIVTGQILGLQFWFKILVFLPLFLLPLTTYLVFNQLFRKYKAFFAGIYILLFLFVYTPISQIYQVLSVGLVAQGFSFFLLIISIGFMIREEIEYKLVSGIFLGLVSLSHPFVGVIGFIFSGSLLITTKNYHNLIPASLAGLIFAPWLLNAINLLSYTSSFTFQPAKTGIFLYILLPLIILGGFQDKKTKGFLITFFSLLVISTIELPFITQELRFYTYSIGIGSILAGFGAFEIFDYLSNEINIDKRLIGLFLIIPVIGLSLQADLPNTWGLESELEPVYQNLSEREKGRILVETSNSSIFDSFVLQAKIPVETKHWAVNDVHMDSSTSANYILTLESWLSKNAVENPICRTCESKVSQPIIKNRLNDLGIKYILARTPESKELLNNFTSAQGKYGEYWLFENTKEDKLVVPLENKPITLIGNYDKWRKVNNLLFVTKFSNEIIWSRNEKATNNRTQINMKDKTPEEIVREIKEMDTESIDEGNISYKIKDGKVSINSSVPSRVKLSYFPNTPSSVRAGKFNTIIVGPGKNLTIPR